MNFFFLIDLNFSLSHLFSPKIRLNDLKFEIELKNLITITDYVDADDLNVTDPDDSDVVEQ